MVGEIISFVQVTSFVCVLKLAAWESEWKNAPSNWSVIFFHLDANRSKVITPLLCCSKGKGICLLSHQISASTADRLFFRLIWHHQHTDDDLLHWISTFDLNSTSCSKNISINCNCSDHLLELYLFYFPECAGNNKHLVGGIILPIYSPAFDAGISPWNAAVTRLMRDTRR